jgi:NAD(P)-dependent dehydrogenase (short-subunit alcohol dehydrogenase family)
VPEKALTVSITLMNSQVHGVELDLTAPADVRRFSDGLRAAGDLDILICNAGIMCPLTRQATADNIESQFATNHLGHFVMASKLASDRVQQAKGSKITKPLRVVMVTSMAHQAGIVDYSDLQVRPAPECMQCCRADPTFKSISMCHCT